MKRFFIASTFYLVFAAVGVAQEVRYGSLTTTASIAVVVETPASQALPAPKFRVITAHSQRIYVEESPPMPSLPPVAGMVTLKVETVKDPMLPAPAPAAVPGKSERMTPSQEGDAYLCFVWRRDHYQSSAVDSRLAHGKLQQAVAVQSLRLPGNTSHFSLQPGSRRRPLLDMALRRKRLTLQPSEIYSVKRSPALLDAMVHL